MFSRPLRRDEDDAVRASHAVDAGIGWILQHLDGFDVVRIDDDQRAARAWLHRDVIDDVQWCITGIATRRLGSEGRYRWRESV